MYEKILRDPLLFPDEVSSSARSILTGLLTRDPAQRLGVNGADEIKRHPFFEKIDWRRLAQKKIQPPFKPRVRSPVDVSNFDTVFTAEQPLDSVVEGSQLSQTVQAQFEGASLFLRLGSEGKGERRDLTGDNPLWCFSCRLLVQCTWNYRACGLTDQGLVPSLLNTLSFVLLSTVVIWPWLPVFPSFPRSLTSRPWTPPPLVTYAPAYPGCLISPPVIFTY